MNQRAQAAELLRRVEAGGAYANVLLRDADAGLRSDVYGVLRWQGELDASLSVAVSRPLERLQKEVLAVLRVGAYELLRTDVRASAVVSECVDAIRQMGAPKASGLVNAVLRKVAEADGPEMEVARAGAFPDWLVEDLTAAWGPEEVEAFLLASNTAARPGVRVRPGEPGDGERLEGIPDARLIGRPGDGLTFQDPASVAVVQALDVPAGAKVLDLAAAPGGKTQHLLDLVGPGGRVTALERHARRARTGARRVPDARWVIADGRHPPFTGGFDRVLLDAPCSGLGTLRRRPEIRHRIRAGDVDRLAGLQSELLEAAMGLVAPGGRLVYSVCTITPSETTDVVDGRGFEAPSGLPGRAAGDGWLLAPHLAETDGMFIAAFDA